MPSAIRRLGTFLFCLGCMAVVVALGLKAGGWMDVKMQQLLLASAMVGALLAASGLVMDWLGTHAVRDQQSVNRPTGAVSSGRTSDVKPPPMRLSGRPAGAKGYREDLMA